METETFHSPIKAVIVGEMGVGKSTILSVFRDDFNETISPTIGLDFWSFRVCEDPNIKLWIWEIGGEDWCSVFVREYTSQADIVFVVYDITSQSSFLSALRSVQSLRPRPSQVILLGNKLDQEQMREVPIQRGIKSASFLGCHFNEVSGINRTNVQEVFSAAVAKAHETRLRVEVIKDSMRDEGESPLCTFCTLL